jgi:hypothetical protein
MGKEAISYLNPETQNTVEEWVEGIVPLVERYPQLQDTDLVVEGGMGTGRITTHIAKRLFPNAIYIGTDIADALTHYFQRLRGEIDDETLQRVLDANHNPTYNMENALVYGNCFDWKLITDVANKTDTHHPLLISKNALFALTDRKANPWDRKVFEDLITFTGMTQLPSIYKAQLHLGIVWDLEPQGDNISGDAYYNLEQAARSAGWTTERFDIGLLMVQNKQ